MLAFMPALLVLLILPPGAAAAGELGVGMRVSQDWDSNIRNTSSDEQDKWFLRLTPHAEIQDRTGDLRWRIRYEPSYEVFYTESNLNGWDHSVRMSADYQLTPQTGIRFTERFTSTQSTTSFNESQVGADGGETSEIVLGRRRVNRNALGLELTHRLSAAQILSFSLNHTLRDDDARDSSTVNTLSAGSRFTSSLSERSNAGIGFTWTRQHFDGTRSRNSQDTDFYNGFAFAEHRFDPTLRASVSAGPALVDGGQSNNGPSFVGNVQRYPLINGQFVLANSCSSQGGLRILDFQLTNSRCRQNPLSTNGPTEVRDVFNTREPRKPFVSGGSAASTNLTFFASAAITKEWENLSGQLSFQRRATAGNSVTSEITDTLRSVLNWQATERLTIRLAGNFTRRTQASDLTTRVAVVVPTSNEFISRPPPQIDFPVPDGSARTVGFSTAKVENDLEILQYFSDVSVNYRLRKRLSVFARFFYLNQQPKGDVQVSDDFDDYRVGFGFAFEFDPIYF